MRYCSVMRLSWNDSESFVAAVIRERKKPCLYVSYSTPLSHPLVMFWHNHLKGMLYYVQDVGDTLEDFLYIFLCDWGQRNLKGEEMYSWT